MRKLILVFVLLILFLVFVIFLYNAFILQKKYFEGEKELKSENNTVQTAVEIPSFYKDYLKEDYDKALTDKRVLVLYFTSNWCQECFNQDKTNIQVFEELPKEGIVGLKIHILDSETTTETNALSQKFDVAKELSFVILDKNGAVFFKGTTVLSKDLLKQKILEVLNK